MDFKRQLDALKASGNDEPDGADIVMDFLYALDNSWYGEFKAEVVNDLQKSLSIDLNDLNKMYVLASQRVVAWTGKVKGGTMFATLDQKKKGQGGAENANGKNQNVKDASTKTAEKKLAKMIFFNCGEKGHPAKNCPDKHKDSEEPPLAGMMLDA
jgi:hypothetical protein